MTNYTLHKLLGKRIFTHFLFWLFYVLFFGSVYGKYGNDYKWYLLESVCMLPFIMLATYVTIYVLLPFYLKKRKLFLTLIFVVSLLFFVTLGERIFLRILNSLPITKDTLFGVTFLYLMLETNFMVGIAFAIKIVKKWFEQQQEKYEMEKRNLTSELKFLKAQLHPHFLFNTMNNLYAMSLEESSKTSEGIAKISELLRSVLYDCNDAEIELAKEINLIENFIELEKLRYEDKLDIDFRVEGTVPGNKIAPMVLFTFVENCFKHGSRNNPENAFIKIAIHSTVNCIHFTAQNSVLKRFVSEEKKSGGIGLKNVKKRLDILYGNNYKLQTEQKNNTFLVNLEINKSE